MEKEFKISMVPSLVKWHLTKKVIPIICHVVLTNRCNYHCTFCFVDQKSPTYLPLNIYTQLIDDLKKEGCCYLYISGGEPLTVPQIREYLNYAAQRIPYTHLVTNGSLLKGDLLEVVSMSGISEVSISIDGLETLHDQYRKEGAFKAAIEAIKVLKKRSGPSVTCSTIIGDWNISDMRRLSELMDSLTVPQRFMFYQDYPVSSQKRAGGTKHTVSVDKITSFVSYYLKKHDDTLLPFAPSFFKARIEGKPFAPSILKGPCTLPSYYVNILWQGEVFPCLGMCSTLYPGVGITGTAGEFCLTEQRGLPDIIRSPQYAEMRKRLRGCNECFRFFASCYIRPRLSFPLKNFIKYKFSKKGNVHSLPLHTVRGVTFSS